MSYLLCVTNVRYYRYSYKKDHVHVRIVLGSTRERNWAAINVRPNQSISHKFHIPITLDQGR